MRQRYLTPLAASVAFLVALAAPAIADTGFSVTLDGLQEVPPNASPAFGAGTLVLNNAQNQVTYNISFSGLLAPRSASHIHAPAPAGANAGVVVTLIGPAATSGVLSGVGAISATNAAHMLNGLSYVNIHTSAFPGGEIRGQIHPNIVPTKSTTWGRLKKLYR